MIHEIKIQSFGCIHNATVHLTRFHAFVGPNGAGKTTFFDAVSAINDLYSAWSPGRVWRQITATPSRLLARTERGVADVILERPASDEPPIRTISQDSPLDQLGSCRFDSGLWQYHKTPGENHGKTALKGIDIIAAANDPVVMVEYPEDCLYPAAIAGMMARLRQLSERSQVLITTYSPLVLNEMRPEEVTLVRRNPETEFLAINQTANFANRSRVYALGELWVSYLDGLWEEKGGRLRTGRIP